MTDWTYAAAVTAAKEREADRRRCACGDLLTVVDGTRCRQCVLADRLAGRR